MMREVTLSGRKKEVFRDDVKRAVRRRSAMPWEKSGRKPMQSASEPDALSRYSGLRSAFWWIRILRTILNFEESWRGLWRSLMAFARRSVSGIVVGFAYSWIDRPCDGGPLICSFES